MNVRPLLGLALLLAACGDGATTPADAGNVLPPEDTGPRFDNADLAVTERAPLALSPVALPMGAVPVAPWVGTEGDGLLVLRDGRFFAVDIHGVAREVERLPGERPEAGEGPPTAVVERAPGEPLALVPMGGRVVREGWTRRADLPPLLRGARAMMRWGAEALWATPMGLYTTQGARWFRLDATSGPVTDAVELCAGATSATAREAWVRREDGTLERVTATVQGDALGVAWATQPVRGVDVGRVRAVARWQDHVYVSRDTDILRVDARGAAVRVRIPGEFAGPVALAPSATSLWMAWEAGEVGRLTAAGVEVLARGLALRGGARLAVDAARGDSALVVANGVATRVVVEPTVALLGFHDDEAVTDARLPLRVEAPLPRAVTAVEFQVDGMMVERVTAPPYVWGPNGSPWRRLPALEFGEHTVGVVVRYADAPELRRARRFRYVSPLGRVPSYERDVLPVYTARCARCHSTGVARDLRTYDRLSGQAPVVAEVIQSRRMPPDLEIDATTAQIFTAWVAGGAPR